MSHITQQDQLLLNLNERSPNESSKIGYWPGHVIAESLFDDKEPKHGNHQETGSIKSFTRNNSEVFHSNQADLIDRFMESNETKRVVKIKPGCAFSALTSSMVPVNILQNDSKSQSEDIDSENLNNAETIILNDKEFFYDEFGFKIDDESEDFSSDPENYSSYQSKPNRKNPNTERFVEDSTHKLKWIAYLEFTLNSDVGSNFSWDQVITLNKNEKLRAMIRGQGIPHSLRPFIWMRLSGALKKKNASKFTYSDVLKSLESDTNHISKQIEKDLLRTLPSNICFCTMKSVGIPRLRRILEAIAHLYPNIGYCQGMNTIVATLLLFIEEEDAFWITCTIVEDILPVSYYSHTLLGVQADIKVLGQLINTYLPEIDQKLKKHDIELSLICINWFLTIFSNVFHIKFLLRVWDLFFYEGSTAIFQITLAMFKLNEKNLLNTENSSQIFTLLSELPTDLDSVDSLIETSIRIASSVNKNLLDVSRKKHQAYLMAQHGSIINPSNYQSLPLSKERPNLRNKDLDKTTNRVLTKFFKKSSQSDMNNVDGNNNSSHMNKTSNLNDSDELNEIKMKNIIQTEILVNLRETIIKIVNHFQEYDPNYKDCNLNADYSIESHSKDYENYMDTTKEKQFKRAKALLDFEKTEDDELGFRKNDVITILSTKDDHCWIGEFNGARGWFPSRFVSLIDERNGKIYSPAGDDSINDRISGLIRGEFAIIMKSIFEHGLKRWTVLGGSLHPWSFIEEASRKIVEKDFDSVYSRLVLCKTFRLDEDGKVLTPDELLFRSIQLINLNHDSVRSHLDVKFRALLSIGLNEQVLHIWLETLCSSLETVEKWYHPWSFLRSPGWVQIKCELRILAQLSFMLNPDSELPENKRDAAINECIKDMLIAHHLFSWDIN